MHDPRDKPETPAAPAVLLVEDNDDDLFFIQRALRACGLAPEQVAVARGGDEALDYLFARGAHADRDPDHQPRLILLDLMLPKLSGFEVLERLRDDTRTALLPVVILSASVVPGDVNQCYARGANSFVRKPGQFEESQAVLTQLCRYWLELNVVPG